MIRRHRDIIIAIISAIAVITAAFIGIFPFISSTESFSYSVRVQDKETRLNIPDCQVVIDIANKAPLTRLTDSGGYAQLMINPEYIGQQGRLTVIADGYEIYTQNIDLYPDQLTNIIRLDAKPVSLTPTNVATAVPATVVPATAVPAIAVPATAVPPTAVPPITVLPTATQESTELLPDGVTSASDMPAWLSANVGGTPDQWHRIRNGKWVFRSTSAGGFGETQILSPKVGYLLFGADSGRRNDKGDVVWEDVFIGPGERTFWECSDASTPGPIDSADWTLFNQNIGKHCE